MNQPTSHAVQLGLRRSLVTLAHASTPRLKLANTSLAHLRPVGVSRYSRRRGRPALEGSMDSHWLTNQPADSSRRRIGYKVPDAIPQRWCTSAPANCTAGFSKKASNTRSVCSDIRTLVSFLPIVASLHRVYDECKVSLRFRHAQSVFLSQHFRRTPWPWLPAATTASPIPIST